MDFGIGEGNIAAIGFVDGGYLDRMAKFRMGSCLLANSLYGASRFGIDSVDNVQYAQRHF